MSRGRVNAETQTLMGHFQDDLLKNPKLAHLINM